MKHLHRYTEPKQQRQVIRIIFFPVVYSVLSALSIVDYKVAQYMQPLIELYETFALASLFLLFIEYVAPDEHTRDQYFDTLECRKPKSPFIPSKGFRVVPGGSRKWFQIKWIAIFGYVIVDIAFTVGNEVSLATGTFCATSWRPRYFHAWYEIVTNFFLGWAVMCIIILYTRFNKEPNFAQHKPGLKLVSFKLIVLFNFIQSIVFSSIDIKTSPKFTIDDLTLGLPAAVISVEQIFFAIFFHYSFRSREYHETMKAGMVAPRMGTFRAAANAFNPADLIMAMFTAVRLVAAGFGKPLGGAGSGRSDRRFEGTSRFEPTKEQTAYPQPASITVTPPRHAHGGMEHGQTEQAGLMRNLYPNSSPPTYEAPKDISTGLNPYAYNRTHSRDSSVDAVETRSTRQMM